MDTEELYPLTESQKLIFLAESYTTHKQLMNIPTSCFLEGEIDTSLMMKAAAAAVLRNDSFGIRFVKKGKENLQYFVDPQILLLEEKDFRGKTDVDMEDFLYSVGRKKMAVYGSPLCKIYVVISPEEKIGLFVCISHLIMDSWSISMFYKDIADVYDSMKNNKPMPAPIPSYRSLLKKEIAYPASDKHRKDIEYWEREMSGDPPIYTHVNGAYMLEKWRRFKRDPDYRFGRGVYFRTTAKHAIFMVEKKDVDEMLAFLEKQSLPSLQALFFVGIRMYLAIVNGRQKDVSILSIVARRGTLEEKLAGGTRAIGLPLRTVMEEDMSFLDAIRMVLEKQNYIYRHSDMGTMEIYGIMHKNFGYKPYETCFPLHITFQPVALVGKNGEKAETKWYCNGAAASDFSISIMDGDGTGALRCYYEYQDKQIKKYIPGNVHRTMLRVIMAGIRNPDITIGDLLSIPTESEPSETR